jgi:hypothetical protein
MQPNMLSTNSLHGSKTTRSNAILLKEEVLKSAKGDKGRNIHITLTKIVAF